MPTIHLTTFIAAPQERVFDLSRSIDIHRKSMIHYKETAVSGVTAGLIGLGETVTWKAKHLGKMRFLRAKVTAMDRPHSFTDEQIMGDFKSLKHEHYFKAVHNGTIVIDLFSFETPYGKAGMLLNKIYLNNYLKKLLEQRNETIRQYAESDKWKYLLEHNMVRY
ncbi:MAG: SRPBCC family protein [Williamsia sp.]|nr:SRPBCC family protein [Williamsia sp.]